MKFFLIEEKISENLAGLEKTVFYKFLSKSQKSDKNAEKTARQIVKNTQKNGDEALIFYSNEFDKTNFKKACELLVDEKEVLDAAKNLDLKIKSALKTAFLRIKKYHQKQLPKDFNFIDKTGVELGNIWRAVDSVGVYVPGGTASYPSSVLMSAVPAIVAGVKQISICAPSSAGKINPAVLFAAQLCGVKKIYKIGGAQSIAALAYGTKTVAKVNKIVGPGNSYVAAAKKIVFGDVGIDMIAGPTDITIIADKNCNAAWIAADALSQLEHGTDSKSFIITNDKIFAKEIVKEITKLSKNLPRQNIIEKSLKNSAIFVIKNLSEATHLANFIAPEHLEIASKNAKKFVPKIKNAGAIFLGSHTPEAIGDYVAGPSHTLPTLGSAKFSSGLSVFDFLKRISLIACDEKSFFKLSKTTATLAKCEGLDAHALSIKIRDNPKLTR
jgi:histidinol dehydrogenase